jgi:hypothetical protein
MIISLHKINLIHPQNTVPREYGYNRRDQGKVTAYHLIYRFKNIVFKVIFDILIGFISRYTAYIKSMQVTVQVYLYYMFIAWVDCVLQRPGLASVLQHHHQGVYLIKRKLYNSCAQNLKTLKYTYMGYKSP